ncbi:MAG: phospholipase [Actinomycetota bacterium]|nr:phospholipase [Actinomycetota bacterium]
MARLGVSARLTSRPLGLPPGALAPPGLREIAAGSGRPSLLYAPPGLDPETPAPFAVLCHGAGSDAPAGLSLLRDLADETGTILLAPASRAPTWDVIAGGYGPDVAVIDAALEQVFAIHAVDPARLALGGFSDGASYALSLGLSNGSLFSHLIAFSPGFASPARPEGAPRIFMTHGAGDRVLPIERCSRRLAPLLRDAGYDLSYEAFDGGHVVPPDLARAAMRWLVD